MTTLDLKSIPTRTVCVLVRERQFGPYTDSASLALMRSCESVRLFLHRLLLPGTLVLWKV